MPIEPSEGNMLSFNTLTGWYCRSKLIRRLSLVHSPILQVASLSSTCQMHIVLQQTRPLQWFMLVILTALCQSNLRKKASLLAGHSIHLACGKSLFRSVSSVSNLVVCKFWRHYPYSWLLALSLCHLWIDDWHLLPHCCALAQLPLL